MMLIEAQIDPRDNSTRGKHGRICAIQHANRPTNDGQDEHSQGNVAAAAE